MDLPAAPPPAPAATPDAERSAYRVLARKYRPQRFSELIGQDAMVQTLANAIKRERLAHAFIMTGVRGVGKTSTARLIAKGLNCIGANGQGGPTIDPCGVCDPCVAIAEGRHIDIIEMDAASHTGVDDVREIIEAVRYAAVSARYKIYIIDEVHMLTKNAFNALLKTLEEPPAHVKFIFATTEINKVPITVLSRCQRFDLRRITPELLLSHFQKICGLEAVDAEEEALRMVAVAAQGSVRDGLSILDQAIAHADLDGEGRVTAHQVQDMLGLSDGGATRRLFDHVLKGEDAAAIDVAREQYALGVEPVAMVRGMLALTHAVALTRAARGDDPALTPEDRTAVRDWAAQLGMAQAQRLWQLMLTAHEEIATAPDGFVALEMTLLRLTHAATMPDPDELVRLLRDGIPAGATVHAPSPAVASAPVPAATMQPPAPLVVPEPEVAAAPEFEAPVVEAPVEAPPAPVAPLFVEERKPEPPRPEPAMSQVAEEVEAPTPTLDNIAAIAQFMSDCGEHVLGSALRRDGRLISLEPGKLVLARGEQVDERVAAQLASALTRRAGQEWTVSIGAGTGAMTPHEQKAAIAAENAAVIREHPMVRAVIELFPEAELLPPEALQRRAG